MDRFDTGSKGQFSIDRNALRWNQGCIVALVVVAFVAGGNAGAWIVLFLGVSLAIGALLPGYGPLQLLYRHGVLKTGVLKANVVNEDPAQHRFAQVLGSVFLVVSGLLLFADFAILGWVLAAVVLTLALVNLVFGFCAGCFMFLHLERVLKRGAVAR
ncbi:DUF4395 domain-containing protein [soil metagenome]